MLTADVWYLFTSLAEPWFMLFLLALLFVIYFTAERRESGWRVPYRRFLTLLVISLAVTYIVVIGLKETFPVPRECVPCPADGCNPYCPGDTAFPSGHSALGFALFASLYLAARDKKLLPVFILPLLIAYSRLALEVHTIPDVVAGSVIGLGTTFIVSEFVVKRKLQLF